MTLPIDQEDDLNTHGLGSMRSPGVVTFTGHDRNQEWDTQKAKGQTGASSTHEGEAIGQFQATYYLVTEEDFTQWDPFQRLIESMTSGPTPIALPISHPDLARNRFTAVSQASVGGRIYDGRGGAMHVVKYIEYKPPKPKPSAKAKAKPGAGAAGAGAAAGRPQRPDPNADAKRELAALLEEARRP